MSRTLHDFTVPPGHPALPGHFPGNPVVPGVVLLDLARECIAGGKDWALKSIPAARFLRPVRPGETLTLEVELHADATDLRARFRGLHHGLVAFEGSLVFSTGGAA